MGFQALGGLVDDKAVDGVEKRKGAGFQDVRAGADADGGFAVLLYLHHDFAHGFPAHAAGPDGVVLELEFEAGGGFDGGEDGGHRAVADGGFQDGLFAALDFYGGGGDLTVAARHAEILHLVHGLGVQVSGGLDDGDEVLVVDVFLLVGHVLEALHALGDLVVRKVEAELLQAEGEGVAAAVLAQHQAAFQIVGLKADVLGGHDLVGGLVGEKAVLMDAGFVPEGVVAYDGLVGGHGERGDLGDETTGRHDLLGVDPGVDVESR